MKKLPEVFYKPVIEAVGNLMVAAFDQSGPPFPRDVEYIRVPLEVARAITCGHYQPDRFEHRFTWATRHPKVYDTDENKVVIGFAWPNLKGDQQDEYLGKVPKWAERDNSGRGAFEIDLDEPPIGMKQPVELLHIALNGLREKQRELSVE